jgi:hypothetical protein
MGFNKYEATRNQGRIVVELEQAELFTRRTPRERVAREVSLESAKGAGDFSLMISISSELFSGAFFVFRCRGPSRASH